MSKTRLPRSNEVHLVATSEWLPETILIISEMTLTSTTAQVSYHLFLLRSASLTIIFSGTLRAFLSGKIAYAFKWSGPSVVLDTACSGSLIAIYQACRALQNGDCTAAIAGGVNVITSPDVRSPQKFSRLSLIQVIRCTLDFRGLISSAQLDSASLSTLPQMAIVEQRAAVFLSSSAYQTQSKRETVFTA